MEIEKQALEYLVDLGKKLTEPFEKEYNGRKYINKELRAMEDPLVSALKVSTLQSLDELCNGKFAAGEGAVAFEGFNIEKHVLHVVDEEQVQVIAALSNAWGKREVLIDCNLPESVGFRFGQYVSHEEFIIGLLSQFKETEDQKYALRIASSLTTERVVTSDDDGISQGVGLKAGVSLKTAEVLKGRLKLAPFRTFREVEQPVSEFVFRVKQSGEQTPLLALFEADGGSWKLKAREHIARWLSVHIKDAVVAY